MATDDLISHAGPGSLASGEIGECPVVRWGRFSRKRVQTVGTAFVLTLTWAAIPRRDWFVSVVLAGAFVFAERGIARWRMKKQKDGSTGWLRYGPSIVETGRVDEYAGAVRDLGRRVAPLRSEIEEIVGVPVVVCGEAQDRYAIRRVPADRNSGQSCHVELHLPVACRRWPEDALRWLCVDMALFAGPPSSWARHVRLAWLRWLCVLAFFVSVVAEVQAAGVRLALPSWPAPVFASVVAVQILLLVELGGVARLERQEVLHADMMATERVGPDGARVSLDHLSGEEGGSRSVLTDLLDELRILFGRLPSHADRLAAALKRV
jgi:hypothetical protein